MKIVIAPDSFKESLSAMEVAQAIECGFREIYPDADYALVPMADGGEGTVESMVEASGGQFRYTEVSGPLGETVSARWGVMGDGRTAVIEMAAASGLNLVPPERRNPLNTTSYGFGQLIAAALDDGVERIILGIGGSATNDGGAGMMQALGVRLLTAGGDELAHCGGALQELDRIDLSGCHPRLAAVALTVACDVNNPLCGERGASAVFGQQKGATPEMIPGLDAMLNRWGEVMAKTTGRDVRDAPGAGAAGGTGAALLGLLDAALQPGVEIVVDALGLEAQVQDATLVITGEGRIDSQSISGKTPIGVAAVAKKYGKPAIAVAGGLKADHRVVYEHGLDAAFAILPGVVTLEQALENARDNLVLTARNIAAVWKAAQE